ncbi:hypothetical protein EV143_10259 [Flavobacterium chryseum]|nr:hypothetical protein EV143_10259 [Flavobacterium sp. P3160]
MSSIGAFWLLAFGDLDWTNFYTFYGRFEEIGLLYVVAVFDCLKEFGLNVLLGIDRKNYLISKNDYMNMSIFIILHQIYHLLICVHEIKV